MAGRAACWRIRLRPQSPWLTPWHADALFGCVCWRYSELAGDEALHDWLDAFRAGEPPFVLSDAFPDGWLPTPALADFEDEPKGKQKRPGLMTEAAFDLWRQTPGMVLKRPKDADTPGEVRSVRGLHVTLDRNSGTPLEEGGLFELDGAFPAEGAPKRFSVFVRGTAEVAASVHACFELQALRGFGKRSSAGFGAFSVEPLETCALLDAMGDANGFVSLSHFVPGDDDPTDGAWALRVKYPKFQGDRVEHPFKGRLVTLTPGSTFRTEGAPHGWYGRTFDIQRGERAALHYALCLGAPARLAGRSAA